MKKIYPDKIKKKANPLVKEVWESKIKQSPSKNKHISYSQLSTFTNCQRQWYLQYLKKLAPYQPSIHACFGTAMHETIQTWLETIYHDKVKTANEMDLSKLLYENMIKSYKSTRAQNSHQDFSNADELNMFWLDGKHILDYLKKKRGGYFSTKSDRLAGVETLLYQELRPGVMFNDMELVGIPHTIIIGERNLDENKVEYKNRRSGEKQLIEVEQLAEFVSDL